MTSSERRGQAAPVTTKGGAPAAASDGVRRLPGAVWPVTGELLPAWSPRWRTYVTTAGWYAGGA